MISSDVRILTTDDRKEGWDGMGWIWGEREIYRIPELRGQTQAVTAAARVGDGGSVLTECGRNFGISSRESVRCTS